MKLQHLLSYVRRGVDDYNMIEEGDKIAVGISGGKDSLCLLYAMKGLQRFYPKKFDLIAVSVHLGFEDMDYSPVAKLCEELDVPYYVVQSEIAEIVFKARKEESPCSLCAKMRKGALNDFVKSMGCNKIAYGHHKDDIIETLLMSLIYEGRFHTFAPVTHLDRQDLYVIRPMLYIAEADVLGFTNKMEVPVVKNTCPVDGFTKREYIKNLIRTLNLENPGVKNRMFTAITNSNIRGWNKETK